MGVKIQIGADTTGAMAQVKDLQLAIDKLGGSFGASWSKSAIKRNPELLALMGVGSGGIPYTSAGGNIDVEFPIDKFANKFGASQRQMRQVMMELSPALKNYERDLIGAFSGMQWNVPPIPPPVLSGGIKPDMRMMGLGAVAGM